MSEQQQQVTKTINFVSRNNLIILFFLLCGLAIGLGWYLKSSKVYQASALIMYQQQANPARTSGLDTRPQEMINTVAQQVTSLSSLQEMIETLELYADRREQQPVFDVAEAMREHIDITSERGTDAFRVSFKGDDPNQVMRVANALAARFLEENIRFREQRVTEASAYIRDELAIAKEAMDEQEERMRDYKLKHYNQMPERQNVNMAQLNTLQTQYQNIQNNLQELKRTKLMIQEQINMRQDFLARQADGQGSAGGGGEALTDLERLVNRLDELRSRYTDNHPDVRRLKSRISSLQTEQGVGGDESGREGNYRARDNQLAQLELQLNETDISISRLNEEQDKVRERIAQVQQWVEAAPVREAEWAALTRDYSQLKQHYETLVSRSLEADSEEMLEHRQRGSQFRIIESAHLPSTPFSPNFKKIMFIAVVLSLGMGLGLGYAREYLDTSFKDVDDLEAELGLPVTCAIPAISTDREKRRKQMGNLVMIVGLGSAYAVLAGAILMLWIQGGIVI